MRRRVVAVVIGLLSLVALPGLPGPPVLAAQPVPFDQAVRDLSSPEVDVRLKAVQLLRDAAYPEAAVPLAPLVVDPRDEVQLEAIAAELNIFLADKVVTKKRVAGVVEVRS